MPDVGMIVSGVGLVRSVSELVGLTETLGKKIDKLSQSELAAALRNLDQACSSTGEWQSLVREARNCFNRAIALESGYRRGVAYLGLALCHSQLHDRENCFKALRELLTLMPVPSLTTEINAKAEADKKRMGSLEKIFDLLGVYGDLKVLGTVVARRAKYTPEVIRRVAQPTREELILWIAMDSDAGALTKLQILVAAHLGAAVGWMEKSQIGPKDLGI